MNSEPDRLAKLFEVTHPARTPADAKPDARALAARDAIMATPRRRSSSHARAWLPIALPTAAALAVVLLLVVVWRPSAAVAVTPKPIGFSGTASVAEVATAAEQRLGSISGLPAPERRSESVSWSLRVDSDEGSAERSISPQITTLRWNEDRSGELRVVAGEPYLPDGQPSPGDTSVPAAGEVLTEMRFGPGGWETPVVAPPGDSGEDVLAFLTAFGLPGSAAAGDVVNAIRGALDQWTLTNEQHAQLLTILAASSGVTALGEGVDRKGRDVAGLSVTSTIPGAENVVLVSRDSGRIVGMETIQKRASEMVPAGSVISYVLWDAS